MENKQEQTTPIRTAYPIPDKDRDDLFITAMKVKEEETLDYHSEKDWKTMNDEQERRRCNARQERQKKAEDLLKDNPLFKRACTTLDRLEKGQPVLTVDEYRQRYFDLEIDATTAEVMGAGFSKEVLAKNDSVEDNHALEYIAGNPENIVAYGRSADMSR